MAKELTKDEAIKDLMEWLDISKVDVNVTNQYSQGFAHGMEYMIKMILLTHYDIDYDKAHKK